MKNIMFLLTAIMIFTIPSCTKEESSQLKEDCDHLNIEVQLDPICNFLPSSNPNAQFGIRVIYQDSPLGLDGFNFLWESTGSMGSAALITYSDLPMSVIVTEIETGCEVVLTIDNDYWE